MELASLTFVGREENVVFLRPLGVGSPSVYRARLPRTQKGNKDALLQRSRPVLTLEAARRQGCYRLDVSSGQYLQFADHR